jgi:hypothetical protein
MNSLCEQTATANSFRAPYVFSAGEGRLGILMFEAAPSRPQMRDNQGSNTMRDATFSRRDMLWAGGALTVGAAFAEPLKAAAAEPSGAGPAPTSWADSAMPEVTHRMIETNGIRLHVAEQGEGPLVIPPQPANPRQLASPVRAVIFKRTT